MKRIIFVLFFFVYLFVFKASVFAQEEIKSFDVSVVASKDGTMTVSENINYNFAGTPHHGIYRTIPLVSKVGDLYRVINVDFLAVKKDGEEEEFTVDHQSKSAKIKIGDPDHTIVGEHNYIIIYRVENGIGSNYEDHDEIYWNVTGNEWAVPIEKASYKIETDFGLKPLESLCFTGPFSSKFQDCKVNENFINTTQILSPNQGLTIVTKFPVNTFPKSILQTSEPSLDPDFITLLKIYLPIALVLNFILAPFLLYWYFKNKSKVRFGKPSVNFDIPKHLGKVITPAEAGIIDNTKLEKDDIVATIFDLAIRKYIKIEEIKKIKVLRPDETDYKIILLREYKDSTEFETELLDRLFKEADEVFLKELKTNFYLTFEKLEKAVFESLQTKGFYSKNPKSHKKLLLGIGIAAMCLGNLLLGPILIFLSFKLNSRTPLGDKIDFQVDGLKIFLKSVSRFHKFQTKNLITVEKYIPYAIALGLQDEFMEQIKIINPEYKPGWYSGSHPFFNVYSGMYFSMSATVTTVAPGSSSGFSGSGFSGGGGGGGGGGSW